MRASVADRILRHGSRPARDRVKNGTAVRPRIRLQFLARDGDRRFRRIPEGSLRRRCRRRSSAARCDRRGARYGNFVPTKVHAARRWRSFAGPESRIRRAVPSNSVRLIDQGQGQRGAVGDARAAVATARHRRRSAAHRRGPGRSGQDHVAARRSSRRRRARGTRRRRARSLRLLGDARRRPVDSASTSRAESAFERPEQRTPEDGGRFAVITARPRLPYFASISRKRGSTLSTLNLRGIAAVDAGEQRLGQIIQRLPPKVIDDEFGDAAIGPRRLWGTAKQLESHADLRAPAQQRGLAPWASPWWARSS